MSLTILLALYSVVVVASSLLGGCLPSLIRLTHVRMQMMLSFVGGTMLGVGLLHMLPHSVGELGSLDVALHWMLAGLIGMFLLIRMFHFHEHGVTELEEEGDGAAESLMTGHAGCSHDAPATSGSELPILSAAPSPIAKSEQAHNHDHDHDHTHRHQPTRGHAHGASHSHAHAHGHSHEVHGSSLSWLGVAVGLSLHAFLDGIALGAGIMADLGHEGMGHWAGLGVFLAISLHKPLDALSITALMQARHWSRQSQQLVNAGFALMCPLGAMLFVVLVPANGLGQERWIGAALALAAGIFLCISLSDLLPEVQFHRHDRLKLSAALILGVLCAYLIGYFEPSHDHKDHPHHVSLMEHERVVRLR